MDFNYYTGAPAGDSYYQYNPAVFNFDLSAYPNLISEPLLPPNHSNLFSEYPPSYPSYPAAPAAPIGHPHMSVSSAQGGQMYPSVSDYPPSNGSYSWLNSPSSATMHPPTSLPVPPVPPMGPHSPHDDQRVQQELLDMLDEFQQPIDNFYINPQGFLPSPFQGPGVDSGDTSPPSSILKPSFDEDLLDSDDEDDFDLDLEDLELPTGVTEGDLSALKIPDLNKKLRDLGLSRDDQNLVKKIRRQHKNRRYAHTCRQKKVDKKNTMKVQKQVLESEINELKLDVENLRRERDEYKRNYELMQKRKQEGIRA